ncbi:hypothetical protein F2Q69_00060590 [Brassica cretica]|uniref:Uncharacterized protein n=1 Tax=Brassica cretica TaxID=69181 RepID=A0A8S9RJM2_BRACR|nr:hypothetical protein F2Q69_00060590 [Brassica cretica]
MVKTKILRSPQTCEVIKDDLMPEVLTINLNGEGRRISTERDDGSRRRETDLDGKMPISTERDRFRRRGAMGLDRERKMRWRKRLC